MTPHPFRWASFVFGVLFALITAGWVAVETELLTGGQLRLAGPITLIVLGLVGVALTFRSKR